MGGYITKTKKRNFQIYDPKSRLPVTDDKRLSKRDHRSHKIENNFPSENVTRIPSPYLGSYRNTSPDSEQSWPTSHSSIPKETNYANVMQNYRHSIRKHIYQNSNKTSENREIKAAKHKKGSNRHNLNGDHTQDRPSSVKLEDKCPVKLNGYDTQTKLAPLTPVSLPADYHRGDGGGRSMERVINASYMMPPDKNKCFDNSGEADSSDISVKEYPKDFPIGDTPDNMILANVVPKSSPRNHFIKPNSVLLEKPPTPPQKPITTRLKTPNPPNPTNTIRKQLSPNDQNRKITRSFDQKAMHRNTLPRCRSLTRPPVADRSSRESVKSSDCNSQTKKLRRTSSISEKRVEDCQVDKSQFLARIEYTFYINDTEAHQRPFYDRRVEAVARASQCNICLHIPPPGHRPVYYKGMRVLPVTISAHSMVALKRCIARLDMQYPYFNVKAFCPSDMY